MAEPIENLQDDLEDEVEEEWRSAPLGADGPSPSHRRCVIHVDIDCFYAQVEMLERPELRDKPLGIQQKNIVVTCNYVARARGVGKCVYIPDALRACPELVLVNGSDLTRYRRMSARIHRVLARFSRRVERLGFDENFLDVTEAAAERLAAGATLDPLPGHALGRRDGCQCGCAARLAAAAHIAADVRRALREDLGITSCAGVGFNKLLAKLAGARHKPDQQTVVFASGADDLLLAAGSAKALPGIGSRTAEMLAQIGVKTVEDLRRTSTEKLTPVLGTAAGAVRDLAFGGDPSEVKTSSAALSIGVEDGFKRVDNVEECEVKMRELARRVMVLLEEDGRVPTVLKVSLRRYHKDNYYRFRETRQSKVTPSLFARGRDEVETVDRVVAEAMILLKKMLREEAFHLTLLGLAVTGFAEQGEATQSGIAKFIQKAGEKRKQCVDSEKVHRSGETLPKGIDQSVWESLPPDIQSELLQSQDVIPSKKRKQKSIPSFFGGAAGSSCKPDPDVITVDEDEDCEAERKNDNVEESSELMPRVEGESPGKALEGTENVSKCQDTESDEDDPGSPVVSRSIVKTEVDRLLADNGEPTTSSETQYGAPDTEASDDPTADNSGVDEEDCVEVSPVPDASGTTCEGSRERGSSEILDQHASPRPSSPAGPEPADRRVLSPDPPSQGEPADDWDQDVFSQLPPDIQFELKMARRVERQTSAAVRRKASPRETGKSTGKPGTILKFFKK